MATDQNLEILINADSSGVKTGMGDAKQSVVNANKAMQQSSEQLASSTKTAFQQISDALKGWSLTHTDAMKTAANESQSFAKTAAESMNSAVANMKGSLGGLGEAVGFVGKHFAALAALAAGAGIFKEGINETKKFTGEAIGLSKALGISATEAGILNVALGDVFITSEEYSNMSRGLTRQLKMNEDAVKAMGITTRDTNGNFRNQADIMKDAGAVLEQYKEGTDRNLAAQVIFGRGVQDASKAIKAANVDMEAAKKKSEELGLVLSVQNVKDAKAYKSAMNELEDALMAIKKAIGDQVMPIFTEFAQWLADVGPAAVVITKGAFGGLAATFWYVRNGVVVLWETIKAMVVSVAEPIRALSASIGKALSGDFSGAKNEIANIGSEIGKQWSSAMDEIAKSSEKTNEKVKNLFMQGDPTKANKTGTKNFVDPNKKDDPEKSAMRGFETELAERKVAYGEAQRLEGSFKEFSKEQELAFWQAKLKQVAAGSDDEKSIRMKVAQQKLAIDKASFEAELANLKTQEAEYKYNTNTKLVLAEQYADKVKKAYGAESTQYAEAQKTIVQIKRMAAQQVRQIQDEQSKVEEAYTLDRVAQEREASQLRTQLGIQTKAQELTQERTFENEIYSIKLKPLQDRLALAEKDPDKNPVLVAKIHADIEQLEVQHNQRMRQLGNQFTVEQNRNWTSMFASIQSGMANVLKGVMMGTMTLGQAIRSMMQSVAESVAATLADMAAKWMVQKALEMTLGKTAAVAGVADNAAVAATAAMSSVAAIPFYGWAMAPEVGAATFATAMGFGASIMSASGGFDIPAGVNPMTQLHEKEMVLPAKHAEVIRGMADGDSSGGGFGGDIHIHATDAQSVKRLFENNGAALFAALKKQGRNHGV